MGVTDDARLIIERRMTQRVMKYWESLCRGRVMPDECDIDPDALGDDWPNCFLLQTRDIEHIEQFNFTYLGENILQAYQQASIDHDNLFLVGPNAFSLAPRFVHVAQTAAPLVDEGTFFESNGMKILYRQCLLPIGSKTKRVDAIFGAMLFRTDVKPPF
jgi:hypothetical protein